MPWRRYSGRTPSVAIQAMPSRAARVPGDKTDHLAIHNRFQADHLRPGENSHQVQQGPGILGETGLFYAAQWPEVTQVGGEDVHGEERSEKSRE